jgi:hypothetical protein
MRRSECSRVLMDAHEQPDGVGAVGREHRSGKFNRVNHEPLHTYGWPTERQHLDPTSKSLHDGAPSSAVRFSGSYNDLRIMGRAAAPSILVERSARAPHVWGLLQPLAASTPRWPSRSLSRSHAVVDQPAGTWLLASASRPLRATGKHRGASGQAEHG